MTRDFRPASLDQKDDSVWNHPHVYLGAIAIFLYVGAEVSIGSFLVKYLADPTIAGLPLQEGARLVALYWAGMMLGTLYRSCSDAESIRC